MSLQATLTAQTDGIFGDLVSIETLFVDGGPDFSVAVTGKHIVMTVGTTAGATNLAWDEIAADFNADPFASLLATMVGTPASNVISNTTSGPFVGGSAGLGAGQFYSGSPVPAPAELEVDVVFVGVVRFMIREVPT